jgi:hypothetical protein
VKHFKHEMRGKRRLHKRPNAYEIERCRVWLELEREMVKPAVMVALGASAARSLLGRPVTITKLRGRMLELPDGTAAFVTIHPSFLLRIEDDADKKREYAISSPICGWPNSARRQRRRRADRGTARVNVYSSSVKRPLTSAASASITSPPRFRSLRS